MDKCNWLYGGHDWSKWEEVSSSSWQSKNRATGGIIETFKIIVFKKVCSKCGLPKYKNIKVGTS